MYAFAQNVHGVLNSGKDRHEEYTTLCVYLGIWSKNEKQSCINIGKISNQVTKLYVFYYAYYLKGSY